MRIAHNLVIDHFRKNNRMPKFDNTGEFSIFSVLSDTSLNAEKALIKDQVETDVRRLIEELPDDQKEVLMMRMYQDIGVEPKDVHKSEWAWANINFDAVIDNHGTLIQLKNQVQDHLVSSELLASA